jgi:hypothetical protein
MVLITSVAVARLVSIRFVMFVILPSFTYDSIVHDASGMRGGLLRQVCDEIEENVDGWMRKSDLMVYEKNGRLKIEKRKGKAGKPALPPGLRSGDYGG